MAEARIHDGHRERLRQKFLKSGLDILADHEVLEFLLFYAIPRQNTNPIAHRIIKEFGTLHTLLEADAETIARVCKVSMNTAVLISMILPMARRYEASKWADSGELSTSEAACEYAKGLFIGETDEVFYMICLDAKNRIIFPVEIARGTIDKAPIYPRVIMEEALKHNAVSVILAHNHPSGQLFPSPSDLKATSHIHDILENIEVRVCDHIIVGGKGELSFAQKKLMHF